MTRALLLVVALFSTAALAQPKSTGGGGGLAGVTSNGSTVTSTLPILGPNGSAAAPAYAFASDTNTGMYRLGEDYIAWSTGGTLKLALATHLEVSNSVLTSAGTAGSPAIGWSVDFDGTGTGLYRSAANEVSVSANGAQAFSVGAVESRAVGYLSANSTGVAGAPAAGDCDANSERGRMVIDTTNNRLYVCNGATRLWDYVALTD